MFEYKVWAYAVLVKAKAYILDEAPVGLDKAYQ
jgi:hypothetical protein